MKEIIEKMVIDGKLTDLQKVRKRKTNPLQKITCQIFSENVERLTKGRAGFKDNPNLFHQMVNHTRSCIRCTEKFGGTMSVK